MWQDMGAGSLHAAMGKAMNALLVKQEVRPIVAPSQSYVKLPDVPTSNGASTTLPVRGCRAGRAGAEKSSSRMSDLWVWRRIRTRCRG